MSKPRLAKYKIGDVVRHRLYPFRGVVFDVDPTFANTEEWWQSIPAEVTPGSTVFGRNGSPREVRRDASHLGAYSLSEMRPLSGATQAPFP